MASSVFLVEKVILLICIKPGDMKYRLKKTNSTQKQRLSFTKLTLYPFHSVSIPPFLALLNSAFLSVFPAASERLICERGRLWRREKKEKKTDSSGSLSPDTCLFSYFIFSYIAPFLWLSLLFPPFTFPYSLTFISLSVCAL